MPTSKEITDLYQTHSLRKVASLLGLSYSGLNYWIKVYGITKRTRSEAQSSTRNHRFGKTGPESKRFGHKHFDSTKTKLASERVGSGNPHWKGGVTSLTNRIRQIREYKLWRALCLQRDGCCQQCGSKVNLEVDHLCRLRDLLREFQVTTVNLAKQCSALWDVSNGTTLCHSCHRRKHFKS